MISLYFSLTEYRKRKRKMTIRKIEKEKMTLVLKEYYSYSQMQRLRYVRAIINVIVVQH